MNYYRKAFSALGYALSVFIFPGLGAAAVPSEPERSEANLIEECGDTSTDDFASYMTGDWQTPAPGKLQKMIIASDPQPFRAMITRSPYQEEVSESRWKLNMSAARMAALRIQRQGDAYVPLIINGDMTDFGHEGEREALREKLKLAPSQKAGPLILPGLGNHDYSNNVGDCRDNRCARDAICDHIKWVKAIKGKSRNVSFDYAYSPNKYSGSLSYSFDIGKVHVVQLNVEPTYSASFNSGFKDFDITSSMAWVAADLRAAKARGQVIIVNMHKRDDWKDKTKVNAFKDLLEETGVVAVFAGHYHGQLGRAGSFGRVPVYQTGGLLAKSFLALYFDWKENVLHIKYVADDADVGEDFVRVGPAPEPPSGSLKVTLYALRNYGGESCTIFLEPKAEKQWLDAKCPLQANRNSMSMKVFGYNMTTHGTLCLHGTGTQRCWYGDYTGDFSLPQLQDLNTLPEGLKRKGWGFGNSGFYTIELEN